MPASIRYAHGPGQTRWPVPFEFTSASEVGANLVLPDGRERQLKQDRDYILLGNSIVAIVPPGHAIIVYRAGLADNAFQSALSRLASQQQGLQADAAGAADSGSAGIIDNAAHGSAEATGLASMVSATEMTSATDAATLVPPHSSIPSAHVLPAVETQCQSAGQSGSCVPVQPTGQPAVQPISLAAAQPAVQPAGTQAPQAAYPANETSYQSAQTESAGAAASSQAASDRLARVEARLAALDEQAAARLIMERQAQTDEQLGRLGQAGASGVAAIEASYGQAVSQLDALAKSAAVSFLADAGQIVAEASQACEAATRAGQDAEAEAEAAHARIAQALAELDARLAHVEEAIGQAATAGASQIALAGEQAQATLADTAASIQAETERASRLAGQAWPVAGWLVLEDDLATRSVFALPEPLAYWPGRNSILAARNGFVLTLGRDFEEVGSGASISNTLRLLGPASRGDIFSFLIMPTNAAQAAEEAARSAEAASFEASRHAASATSAINAVNDAANRAATLGEQKLNAITSQGSQAVANVCAARDSALEQIRSQSTTTRADCVNVWQTATGEIKKLGSSECARALEAWRKAQADIASARIDAMQKAEAAGEQARAHAARASRSAASSQELAECAWQAAFQASLDRAQPGIASVRNLSELNIVVSGVYFLNPMLASRQPFMGIWPVADLADCGFDGVFFLGTPYPDSPKLPDIPYPENPADVPEMKPAAAAGTWLPCDHTHKE